MSLTLEQMTNGLTPDHDLFFAVQPKDPDMRESTSIWLFEENGAFALPRIGIEGEAWSWTNRLYHANFALGDDRILHDTGRGAVPPVLGPDGRPTVFGAGPLTFRCLDPFRRWAVSFDGTAVDGTVTQQIAGALDSSHRRSVRFEAELTMAAPAWVQDNSPEKVAGMTKAEADEAASMGIGWRLEQLFRGEGSLSVDGETRHFKAIGSRIKRQSVRPMSSFRGHCWQSALFPDGSGFSYIAYPPFEDGSEPYNEGYVFKDGRMHAARAVNPPFLRRVMKEGDDVSVELQSELGRTRITASSMLSTFRIQNPEMGRGFNLQQGAARYVWDGQTSYGMIERSATDEQMAAG